MLRSTGPVAKVNPFRFSTKYQDDETDLLYYGYRYYDVSTGRWLSRDPIEENGGQNLYGLVANRPTLDVDRDGRIGTDPDGGRGFRPKCCPGHNTPRSCGQICAMAAEAARKGELFVAGGAVICYGNTKCACLLPFPAIGYEPNLCKEIDVIIMEHETGHLPNTSCTECGLYDAKPGPGVDEDEEECQKRTKSLEQLKQVKSTLTLGCAKVAETLIKGLDEWVSKNCSNGSKKTIK